MRYIAFAALLLSACEQKPSYGSPEYIIADAEREVADKLKDPSSAQFSDVRISETGAICGKVNGKNSFGAFSGAEYFIDLPVGSKAANIEHMEIGAFLASGEGASYPFSEGLKTTDFMSLYEEHCIGISREQQAREKADFIKKFGNN